MELFAIRNFETIPSLTSARASSFSEGRTMKLLWDFLYYSLAFPISSFLVFVFRRYKKDSLTS